MTSGLRCARLTARGTAAIAVFRLRGAPVKTVLGRIFQPRGTVALAPGQIRVGRVVDGDRALDDAVVRIRAVEDGWEAELATSGSVFVTDRIEALLGEAGAAPMPASEVWALGRSIGIVASDRIAADAREGLVRSFADLQTLFFLDALEGNLSRAVQSIEISIGANTSSDLLPRLIERLDALIRRAPFGIAMGQPPVVLLAGIPNSGKSTLFNALLGEDRAIVSPEPGTTRDVVSESVAIAGFPVCLVDSAGVRASPDVVERAGVARARRVLGSADIVVVLIDPMADAQEQAALAETVEPPRRIVVLSTAVRTGEGIADLRARILGASAFGGAASLRQAAPFLPGQRDALLACRDALCAGDRARASGILERLRAGSAA